MNTVTITKLKKSYGSGHAASNALRGLDLTVASGELLAVQGASGSGKTTLLNLLAGFDTPDAGGITILDTDVMALTPAQRTDFRCRHMGFVFQALNLLPTLTAVENIALQLVLNGEPEKQARSAANELLDHAGLADRSGSFPDELSGGEQQRIAVLRGLIHKPDLLLLDEPTSCLDTENATILLGLLKEMNDTRGTTIVISTHDPRVAENSKRTVTICDGVIKP
jgi:putative ABC transport system ATP-binding protein